MRTCQAAGAVMMDAYVFQYRSTFRPSSLLQTSRHNPAPLSPPSSNLSPACKFFTRSTPDSLSSPVVTSASSIEPGPSGQPFPEQSAAESAAHAKRHPPPPHPQRHRLFSLRRTQQSQAPELLYTGERAKRLLDSCATLHSPYAQFPDPIGDGHVETLLGALFRRVLPMNYKCVRSH